MMQPYPSETYQRVHKQPVAGFRLIDLILSSSHLPSFYNLVAEIVSGSRHFSRGFSSSPCSVWELWAGITVGFDQLPQWIEKYIMIQMFGWNSFFPIALPQTQCLLNLIQIYSNTRTNHILCTGISPLRGYSRLRAHGYKLQYPWTGSSWEIKSVVWDGRKGM